MIEIAALVVSVVALILAGLSVLYTHRQAVAVAESTRIDRARRHDERQPRLQVGLRPLNKQDVDRRHLHLAIRLDGPEPLTAVRVEIRDAPGLVFSPSQLGVQARAPQPITEGEMRAPRGTDVLAPGGVLTWQLEIDSREPRRPRTARLLIHTFSGDEPWLTQHEVRIPPGHRTLVASN
ncbi:hypothetical protein GXB85_13515 [Cellulomonas sp. APG4]|uniref:hypothetical protein n=1 Tax=Cellulomonas sp. APG4 TaxID=1538656 RepID=UPI0013797EAC|nr:hypothetical protein [Cellulomonas sp. APG4]NCT91960.1 hypothetical protein [Cellulomonas sp. APG4]